MKSYATEWKKLFAIHKSAKGLISRIHKEFLKFNDKNTNETILIWAKNLNLQFTKEDKRTVNST